MVRHYKIKILPVIVAVFLMAAMTHICHAQTVLSETAANTIVQDSGDSGESTVIINGRYGRINSEGEFVIPAKYIELLGPSDNFYAAKTDDGWGYIDRHGQNLTEFKYDEARPFASGFALVRIGKHTGAIDRAGNEIIPVAFDEIEVDSTGGPVSVILHGRRAPIDGHLNIDFTKIYDEIGPFGGLGPKNLALVRISDRYGLVNRQFKEVTELKYLHIFPFKDGLARTRDKSGFNYINPEGTELLTEPLQDAKDFFGEYALVSRGKGPGVIDRKGNIQEVEFTGDIGIIKRNGKLAIISSGGVPVNDLLYDKIFPFVNNRAIVLRSGNYGYIDPDGYEVVKPVYNEVYDYENGSARVRLGDTWGLIAKSGEYLATPVYSTMSPFTDGLSLVEKSHLFGYIGHDGQEKIHAAYDSISAFEPSGCARTLKNGKYGLVDKSGHETVISTYDYMGAYSDGLYAVGLDGKFGYIDPQGKIIVKLKYDNALPFVNGLGAVCKKDRWGVIDVTGRTIIPIKYDPIENISEETITVHKKDETTTYNRQGKKIR